MPAAAEEATINKPAGVARPWNKTDIHYTLLHTLNLYPTHPHLPRRASTERRARRCTRRLALRQATRLPSSVDACQRRCPFPAPAKPTHSPARPRRRATGTHARAHATRPPHWRDPLPPAAGGPIKLGTAPVERPLKGAPCTAH